MFGKPTLSGAYGRDYKSKQAILDDLNAEKDFQCNPQGCYINLEGIIAEGWTDITVRYKRMAQCVIVKIQDGRAS